MNKLILLAVVLMGYFYGANAISFNLDSRYTEYCLRVEVPPHSTLIGNFISSGRGDENVRFMIFSPDTDIVDRIEKKNQANFRFTHPEASSANYSLCIQRTDRNKKYVSIHYDFTYSQDSSDIGTNSSLSSINDKLATAFTSLKLISGNIENDQGREDIHNELSRSNSSLVNWCTFGKIALIVILGIIEVLAITSFFGGSNKRGYGPVRKGKGILPGTA